MDLEHFTPEQRAQPLASGLLDAVAPWRRGYPHLERQPTVASLDGREGDGRMRVRFSSQVSFVADGWLPSQASLAF